MNWKVLLFIAVIAYGGYNSWQSRAVKHGAGEIAPESPTQQSVGDSKTETINGYQLEPLASFSIQARVLSREDYSVGREADLSPVDLALGWGVMSDEAVLSKIDIKQSNRFYFWHVDEFHIPRESIEQNSANMHMIPANSAIEKTLKSVRVGQVVSIEGYLVEAKAADGWHWKSSLTRNDTGNGACEVVLVKSIVIQ